MGMPVVINLPNATDEQLLATAFDMFREVDERFSPYKSTSEVAKINRTKHAADASPDMQAVLELAERTKQQTNGYFDVWHEGAFDPSGIVKGWAIQRVADWLRSEGLADFYVEAGGDIMTGGVNEAGQPWRIGIRNPFHRQEVVKVVMATNLGVATSGTAIRGQHIYDPHAPSKEFHDIASLTVVAPNIIDADRFATAAFAMGPQGLSFIQQRPGLEGYQIGVDGMATMTSGFERHACQ